jgi:hypothetical protein
MEKRIYPAAIESVSRPEPFERRGYTDAGQAVEALKLLYSRNTKFLRDAFQGLAEGGATDTRYRAFYPEIGVFRWRGCRITPRPIPSISRTTSCSPTTSSMSTSSRPLPAPLADPAGYTGIRRPGKSGDHQPAGVIRHRAKHAADADLSPEAGRWRTASRWSISASARPTPRPRPTISPCCARMPG